MKTIAVGALALATLAGCNTRRKEAEARAEAAEARLVQLDAISATKDSLLNEMMATTSFINEINDEVARVKPAKGEKTVTYQERVMPVAEFRATLLDRIKDLTERLDQSESRLAASQERLRTLARSDREMMGKITAFEAQVEEYKKIVEDQRTQIALLTTQVETLQAENQQLAGDKSALTEEKTQLTQQVTDLTTVANTAYYIIGTKDELMEKGVAVEAGGSRVLGIGWKTGKTLVPAPQLQEALFTALAKDRDFEIALPRTDKKYAIVSPQNVKFVEPAPARDGTWRGTIRITDPQSFWAQSKYLIIVEK